MYKHGSAPAILGKRTTWPLIALCALVVALGVTPAARAETMTLGHLGVTNPNNACSNCHYLQVASDPGVTYVVPSGQWTISSWSGLGGQNAGAVRLDVYRPTGVEGQYGVLAQSAFENVPAGTEATFPVEIAVQGGDVISLATGLGGYPPLIQSLDETDVIGSMIGTPAVGQAVGTGTATAINTSHGRNLNILATLTRPDPLSEITPADPAPAPTCAGSPASPCTPVPSAKFSLGKQLHKRGSAVVSQKITVAGPGILTVGGKGIAPHHVAVSKAGPVTVALVPKGSVLGSLTRHGKAKGTAQIVFTPTGGAPATRTETVHFRLVH